MRTSLLFIGFLACSFLQGQELVSASGSQLNDSAVQMTYSLGELSISTHSNEGITLTQGFNQSRLSIIPLSVVHDWGTEIFPNPVRSDFTVSLEKPDGLLLSVHDLNGRIVRRTKLTQKTTSINMIGLGDGAYQVVITDLKNQKSENYLIVKRK